MEKILIGCFAKKLTISDALKIIEIDVLYSHLALQISYCLEEKTKVNFDVNVFDGFRAEKCRKSTILVICSIKDQERRIFCTGITGALKQLPNMIFLQSQVFDRFSGREIWNSNFLLLWNFFQLYVLCLRSSVWKRPRFFIGI